MYRRQGWLTAVTLGRRNSLKALDANMFNFVLVRYISQLRSLDAVTSDLLSYTDQESQVSSDL
jgi:hypothetical protein